MAKRISVLVVMTCGVTMFAMGARAQSTDQDVRWIEEHGFDTTLFMERCMSLDTSGNQ